MISIVWEDFMDKKGYSAMDNRRTCIVPTAFFKHIVCHKDFQERVIAKYLEAPIASELSNERYMMMAILTKEHDSQR